MLADLLKKQQHGLSLLCKTHQVKKLYAFGSSVTASFTDASDIDLLVEVDEPDPLNRGELLLSLWTSLEELFGKKVDLLTFESIKNQFLKESVDATKMLIYVRQEAEIV